MVVTKLIKNNDNSIIEEAILLNVNVDGLDYFVGYDGSSINVYIKLDDNYKLMHTPYSSVCYAAEPYGNIIDSPIHSMHIFSLSMNSVFKAIRWIGYHTRNSVEYEIPVDTLKRFLEVSIYYYFKRDEFINMDTFDKINYIVSKDYAVLDYGGFIEYKNNINDEEDK